MIELEVTVTCAECRSKRTHKRRIAPEETIKSLCDILDIPEWRIDSELNKYLLERPETRTFCSRQCNNRMRERWGLSPLKDKTKEMNPEEMTMVE